MGRLAPALAALVAALLISQPAPAQERLTGYDPAASQAERGLEQLLQTIPDPARARVHARALARTPHVAGTPAQTHTADYVLTQMAGFGLDTSRATFRVYLPFHDSTVVELVPSPSGARQRLDLDEPPVPADSATLGPIWPAMNAYSGSGDVTAPVVYANYGLPDDYAVLDSLAVSVEGRVVIARYGKSFRGIKAREAERRGAVALILYSDPQDDGYVQGDVYPRGPMRPAAAVQRGSLFNGRGDPSTPGWPSTPNARRLPRDSMAVPGIPVVPLGYGNAARILEGLGGPSVPQPWQGGLPFRYHLGGLAEPAVRVAVWVEDSARAYKTIVNTFGRIQGTTWPEEVVIAGGHRDSWGPGAVDNVSGIVSILEAARAMGQALDAGHRPKRTLVFATWDAEEWGLIGSVEWVEQEADRLRDHTVAYINQDVAAIGTAFGASGTSSLHRFIREMTQAVVHPGDSTSVYHAWRVHQEVADTSEVEIGDLGGGSDFAGFYNHLGIPSLGFGFGGPYGVYHAAYDSYHWMASFGDTAFTSHAAAGRLLALMMARLGNAPIVPFAYDGFGRYLGGLVDRMRPLIEREGWSPESLDRLARAAAAFETAGGRFSQARARGLAAEAPAPLVLARVNAALGMVERDLTRAEGLAGRPWMRNLVFAADRDNGYANIALPAIAEAIRDGDRARTDSEIQEMADRVDRAAARLAQATAALEARDPPD